MRQAARCDERHALMTLPASDGAPERVMPQVTGYLATAGYLFPALRSLMLPIMERQGKAAKQKYRERRAASRSGS